MTRTEAVMKDIAIETDAINAIDLELLTHLPIEAIEELQAKREFHIGRLIFFSFALTAAKRDDENEELIALGRQKKAEMECASNGGHFSYGATKKVICGRCGTEFDNTPAEEEDEDYYDYREHNGVEWFEEEEEPVHPYGCLCLNCSPHMHREY